jgi:CBS domain-containing protein
MKDKLVRDVMSIGVPACKTTTSLPDVARMLFEEGRDILAVMGEQGIQGVISQSDLARAFLEDYESMTAQDVMTTETVSVSADVLLKNAVGTLLEKGFHQLLVMPETKNATPVGVLSKRHLIELMAE